MLTSFHRTQAFGVTAATVATFIIGADHAGRQYELSQYQIGSGTELSKIAHQAEQAEQSLGLDKYGRPQQQLSSEASTSQALMAWGTKNKYKVVFGAWAASMVGSFGCEYCAQGEVAVVRKLTVLLPVLCRHLDDADDLRTEARSGAYDCAGFDRRSFDRKCRTWAEREEGGVAST